MSNLRILVVGAGAVGGYFGGRLLEHGRDVTFLVRQRRAQELATAGLRIRSSLGDATIANPPVALAGNLRGAFDLVLLSCKAYDLDSAIASFAPAVGPETAILPLLNGMRHLDILDARFGPGHVLGGHCLIASTLNEDREIVHLNDSQTIVFGERDGAISDRVRAIDRCMDGAHFDRRASTEIVLEMWEKWMFLATLAGATCLLRAAIGEILTAEGGKDLMLRLFEECQSIGRSQGYRLRKPFLDRALGFLNAEGSTLTASMLRDIESGSAIEADHIVGDLLALGKRQNLSLLPVVYTHLKAYEARRARVATHDSLQARTT